MSKRAEKIIKNPNWNKGVYMCTTTVGDLKTMLKELPDDLRISINDPHNPYGWLDIKQMKLVVSDNPWLDDYIEVTVTRHEK